MKKIILTLVMSVSFLFTMAADLYVNGSGNANTYQTIQMAVDAASSGDNIYVATVGTYSELVTIENKSLFVIAGDANQQFTLSGTIAVNPGAGNEVTIIGMYNGNVTQVTGTSSGTLNLVSSFISSIDVSSGLLRVNVYDCEVGNDFKIATGQVKGCTILSGLFLYSNGNAQGDTIRITANHIEGQLISYTTYAYFEICNNYIENIISTYNSLNQVNAAIYLIGTQSAAGGTNLIANNTIKSEHYTTTSNQSYGPVGILTEISNGQNLVIVNNYILSYNSYSYSSNYGTAPAIKGISSVSNALLANNFYTGSSFAVNFSGSSLVDNGTSSSNWTFNTTNGFITGNDGVDMGVDQVEYRDIDNSRNDIGTFGGPHTWSNYHTTTGKAAIFNLSLPSQLYIGGNHNIKAKGFHKN